MRFISFILIILVASDVMPDPSDDDVFRPRTYYRPNKQILSTVPPDVQLVSRLHKMIFKTQNIQVHPLIICALVTITFLCLASRLFF